MKYKKNRPVSGSNESEMNNRLQRIMEMVNLSPIYEFLGIEVVKIGQGSSLLELPLRKGVTNLFGNIHGGILATLIDSACSVALGTVVEPGETAVTLDLQSNYFAPAHEDFVIAEGTVIHKGRHTSVVEAIIKDKEDCLIAKGKCTYFLNNNSKQDT